MWIIVTIVLGSIISFGSILGSPLLWIVFGLISLAWLTWDEKRSGTVIDPLSTTSLTTVGLMLVLGPIGLIYNSIKALRDRGILA